jgi:PadR family transcriptional regulator, regulatory protein PadR
VRDAWLDKVYICRIYYPMPRRPNNSRQARAVLATLLDQSPRWRHGYDLAKATGLKSGTLYPLLMRLSEHGLLESCWQDPERPGLPPRHFYRLSGSGVALACAQKQSEAAADLIVPPGVLA